jgi:hypothetical protein
MVRRQKKSSTFPKKKLLLLIAGLVAVSALVFYLVNRNDSDNSLADNTSNRSAEDSDGINFDPPTEEEKKATDENKEKIPDGNPTPSTTPPSNKKQVQVVISYADTSGIGAYAVGVFEEGGTCTATIKQSGKTFTKTSTGFGNASYTQCTPMSLDGLGVDTSKQWEVTVSYSSAAAEGTSSKTTVNP